LTLSQVHWKQERLQATARARSQGSGVSELPAHANALLHWAPRLDELRVYTGVRRGNPQLPSLGVHLQYLMSPVLRESLGMVEGKHTGVMCARADFGSAAFGTLLPGDVLLEVDGHKVANDGSINLYGRRLQLVCTSIRPFLKLTCAAPVPPPPFLKPLGKNTPGKAHHLY
jgi:hypothetical protein